MKYDTIPDSRNHLAADKIRTQVIMTKEKYERLKAQANRLGISYSSYINVLISSSEQEQTLIT